MYTSPTRNRAGTAKPKDGAKPYTSEDGRQEGQAGHEHPAPPVAGGQRGEGEGAGDGPDTLGGGEQPGRRGDAARPVMGQVMGHRRDEGDKRGRGQRHDQDRADGGAATRLGPGRPGAHPQRRQQPGLLGGPWGRREAHKDQGHDDSEERRRIGHERHRIAEGGDRHPG